MTTTPKPDEFASLTREMLITQILQLRDLVTMEQASNASAREEIAKLRTEMSKLPQSETVAARYPTNSMCASGHQMVLWMDEDFDRCPVCRAEARVNAIAEMNSLATCGIHGSREDARDTHRHLATRKGESRG